MQLNRISITYNRKGHRTFAVFLLSFLSGYATGLYLVFVVALHLLHLDFNIFKNFRLEEKRMDYNNKQRRKYRGFYKEYVDTEETPC